ncbi:MAG TPA: sugar phosphate isomerase/epimerase family protein [Verrucomicrobiae bacterium]|nr:sugar phosphate isomerase/epimerase family protein [Verrucomicrobiae bacterium]
MRKAAPPIKFAVFLARRDEAALDDLLAALARAGAQGVELCPPAFFPDPVQVTRTERAEFRARVERHGLRIIGFHGLLEGHRSLGFFAGEATVRQTLQLLKEQIKLCQELGGTAVTLGSPKERSHGLDIEPEVAIRLAADEFRRLVPICESRRVCFAVDPASPEETDFIRSFDEGSRLLSLVRHSRIRLALDLRSWHRTGGSLPALVQERLPCITHVRVREGLEPHLPHPCYGEALSAAGYRGWLSADLGPSGTPDFGRIAAVLAQLRGCYS